MSPLTLLTGIVLPLVVTVAMETTVALLLRVGPRTVIAVVYVNFVTNPVLNLVLFLLYGLGVGSTERVVQTAHGPEQRAAAATWVGALLLVLEVLVILVEWRLLAWATRRPRRICWDLLALSVALNAVSGILGTLLIGAIA